MMHTVARPPSYHPQGPLMQKQEKNRELCREGRVTWVVRSETELEEKDKKRNVETIV